MLVVTFAADGAGNSVEVDGVAYAFVRTRLGSFVLRTRCPHRGGPLHLGTVTDSGLLVCPWHGRSTPISRLAARGVPAVRIGNRVTAVLPAPADATVEVRYRPLSAALTAGCH